MQQRVLQSSNSCASSTNSLRALDAYDSDNNTSYSRSSNSNGIVGGRRTKRPSSNNVKRKSSSAFNALLGAIFMTVVFTGVVNYAHILKEQGSLPSGVKFTVLYKEEANASKQFFIGRHGSYSQQILSDVAASKSRFLQYHQASRLEQIKEHKTKQTKTNQTTQDGDYTPLVKIVKRPNPTRKWHHSQLQVEKKQEKGNDKKLKAPAEADESPLHSLDYYFQLTKQEKHDKEPILRLIRDNAGINYISETTYEKLPTWSQITSMYGTGPKVAGLDQCLTFQAYGEIGDKFLAVSGMFNSGTNLLAKILVRNCVLHQKQEKYGGKHRGVRWQVPWGKHTPPKNEEFRLSHVAKKSEGVNAKEVLPAVTIRDPFRWLQSMCSHSYSSKWPRPFRQSDPRFHCPNLVPTGQEKIKLARNGFEPIVEGSKLEKETDGGDEDADVDNNAADEDDAADEDNGENAYHTDEQQEDLIDHKDTTSADLNLHYFPVSVSYSNFTRHHRSLVHLWNEWYQEYIELENYPRVLVRMEDLLFFPDQAVPPICECAGGKIISKKDQHNQTHIKVIAESAKLKSVKARPGEEHTGYLDALIRYGNPNTRSRGLTQQDLQYAKKYLDPGLLELFGYEFPTTTSTSSSMN